MPGHIYSPKTLIKLIHGWIYRLILPVLSRAPGRIENGEFNTVNRWNIIHGLEDFRAGIHGKVLDVGAGTWEFPRKQLEGVCEYTSTDTFEHPNVDVICNIQELSSCFHPDTFDFVICTDVIEHVEKPWVAVKELFAILKPGGELLLTTPFHYPLHGNQYVHDYWRFTQDGLRQLLEEEAGFREVKITFLGHPKNPFSYTVIARK